MDTNYIDIVLLHSPRSKSRFNFKKTFLALEKLKKQGLIKEIGVYFLKIIITSINDDETCSRIY